MNNEPVAIGTAIQSFLVALLGVANAVWNIDPAMNIAITTSIIAGVTLVAMFVRSRVTPVDGPYVQSLKGNHG